MTNETIRGALERIEKALNTINKVWCATTYTPMIEQALEECKEIRRTHELSSFREDAYKMLCDICERESEDE